jgi:pimeloyl-ACP methyl ester carboxylesterase
MCLDGIEALAASIPTTATGSKSTPIVHSFIRFLLLGTSPAGYISLCKAIVDARVPQYSNIEVPLLIITGDEDTSAPRDDINQIMEQCNSKEKELGMLEGVGHWQVLEAYSQVQVLINTFVTAFKDRLEERTRLG